MPEEKKQAKKPELKKEEVKPKVIKEKLEKTKAKKKGKPKVKLTSKARIKISSTNPQLLNNICDQIRDIIQRTGIGIKGPIPLPTKRLRVPVRKTPCGSGRETYETWQMRIHKRIIDIAKDERALRLIMRIPIPKDVNIEMEIID